MKANLIADKKNCVVHFMKKNKRPWLPLSNPQTVTAPPANSASNKRLDVFDLEHKRDTLLCSDLEVRVCSERRSVGHCNTTV